MSEYFSYHLVYAALHQTVASVGVPVGDKLARKLSDNSGLG